MADNRGVIIRVSLILLCAVLLYMVVRYYNSHKSGGAGTPMSRDTFAAMQQQQSGSRRSNKTVPSSQGYPDESGEERFAENDNGSAAQYGGGPNMVVTSSPNDVDPSYGMGSIGGGGAPYNAVESTRGERHRAMSCGDGVNSPNACNPQDQLRQSDLLPRDASNTLWAQVNPAGQGDLKDQNFLTAGYLIGIDTIGESLRNANRQLRSDPPNPQFSVGPWSQSTITHDTNRRNFEIGGDA